MAKELVSDELWSLVEPLIPPEAPKPKGGRPPKEARDVFTGILFVLKTGIQWEDLPQEMGCGCGMTSWRRLRDWHAAGVWEQLHRILLAQLEYAGEIDWRRAVIDSASIRAVGAGKKRVRTPRTAPNQAANTIC